MKLTAEEKPQAARRQMDVAIALLFAQEDTLAALTLAEAAAAIVEELAASADSANPWSFAPTLVCGLDEQPYFSAMREVGPLLDAVAGTPERAQALIESEPIFLLATTILKFGAASQRLSISESVFLLWFLACHLNTIEKSQSFRAPIRAAFGDLSRRTMSFRLPVGRRVLLEEMDKVMRR